MSNHYDVSSFNSNNNNFNNFDPSNQFQSYQSAQNFEVGQMHQSQQIYQQQQQQPQQFYGQSSSSMIGVSQQGLNNGPASTYQHTINDLLVQNSTPTYQQQPQQQNLYNNQVQSNQSVRLIFFMLHMIFKKKIFKYFSRTTLNNCWIQAVQINSKISIPLTIQTIFSSNSRK